MVGRLHDSNEAQAAASLQHPNIVPVYSVGNDRGTHFYMMQYVDGHSLDVIVAQLQQDRQPVLPGEETSSSLVTQQSTNTNHNPLSTRGPRPRR
ncbi:MAG: hypothetical protein U0930_03320 [Pirellulales bacterium]